MTDPEFNKLFPAADPKLTERIRGLQELLAGVIRDAWSSDDSIAQPALKRLEKILDILEE